MINQAIYSCNKGVRDTISESFAAPNTCASETARRVMIDTELMKEEGEVEAFSYILETGKMNRRSTEGFWIVKCSKCSFPRIMAIPEL